MGEMCDFEVKFYPQNWDTSRWTRSRRHGKKEVSMVLTNVQYEKLKAMGGIRALKKIIDAAIPAEPVKATSDTQETK